MPYTRTVYTDFLDPKVDAAHLNNTELGVELAHTNIDAHIALTTTAHGGVVAAAERGGFASAEELLVAMRARNSTISALTEEELVPAAPYPCSVGSVALLFTGAVTASDSTYWTVRLKRFRLSGQDYRTAVLADSPIQYWRLGESSGTNAANEIGGAQAGTYNGGFTLGATGGPLDPNTATTFNGSTGYVSTASATYALGNTFSIEAWVNPAISYTGGLRGSIYSHDSQSFQPMLELGGSGGTNRVSVAAPGQFTAETVDNAVTPGLWHHIVYTRSGTGAGTHKIYVNNVAQTLGTDAANNFVDGASAKAIGRRNAASGQYFNGSIDEVAVYNTTLSAASVDAHWQAGRGETIIATKTTKALDGEAIAIRKPWTFDTSAFNAAGRLLDKNDVLMLDFIPTSTVASLTGPCFMARITAA
jgi:hypothetical protein